MSQLETQPTPSLLGAGRSPAWGRGAGSRRSPRHTRTGVPGPGAARRGGGMLRRHRNHLQKNARTSGNVLGCFRDEKGGQDSRNLLVEEETKPRAAGMGPHEPAGQGLAVVGQEAGHVSGAQALSSQAGQTHFTIKFKRWTSATPGVLDSTPGCPGGHGPRPHPHLSSPHPVPSAAGPPSPAPSCPAAPML